MFNEDHEYVSEEDSDGGENDLLLKFLFAHHRQSYKNGSLDNHESSHNFQKDSIKQSKAA